MSVRVFCSSCKGGDNSIWEGSLFEWQKQLRKRNPLAWFVYALNHEKAHNHEVLVKYPSGRTVSLKLSEES